MTEGTFTIVFFILVTTLPFILSLYFKSKMLVLSNLIGALTAVHTLVTDDGSLHGGIILLFSYGWMYGMTIAGSFVIISLEE